MGFLPGSTSSGPPSCWLLVPGTRVNVAAKVGAKALGQDAQCPQKFRGRNLNSCTQEQNDSNFSLFFRSLAIQGGEQHLLGLYLLVQHTDPSVLPARETPGSDVLVLWVRLGFEWQSPGLCFDCRGVKQYLNNCQALEGAEVPREKREFVAVHG